MIPDPHPSCPSLPQLHAGYLVILPRLETHARIYFRHVRCLDKREDFIQEVRCVAWKWYLTLLRRGKDPNDFTAAFIILAARHVKSGRKLCGQERSKDVLSPLAQQKHGFTVGSLPSSTSAPYENLYSGVHGQQKQDAFEERLRDNTQTPVPEQAAFRIRLYPN